MTEAAIEYIICDITALDRACEDRSWLDSLLSPAELTQADRLRRKDDRAAYRSAHLLLRLMAARRLGLHPTDADGLRFTRICRSCGGAHGKPQLPGAELSLSKSDGWVAVASAPPSSPIGIDIEGLPSEVFPGFDDYVLAPGESVPPGRDEIRERLELWVAKEAAVKATGHGLAVAPSDLQVNRSMAELSGDHATGQWTGAISAPWHAELNGMRSAPVPCPPTHAAALSCADTPRIDPVNLPELLTG